MYSGDPNDLGRPQQFYRELISVPEYSHRIKSMIFASHKDDTYAQIQTKIQQLTDGFTSLQSNYRLHHILQVSLAVGNYLNGTSLKGGAWGFKIQSLQRLEEVKSSDNRMNAAYFVIKQVWKKYQYPMFSKEEIDMYSYLSKLPSSQIASDIGQLRKTLASIRKAQKSNMANNSADNIGKFCQEMRAELQAKVQFFTEKHKVLDDAYHSCAAFYCQNSKGIPSDEFGKKVFKSVFFIFESERIFKVVQDKAKKQQERKAIKSQIIFVQKPEEPKKVQTKSVIMQLPEPPKIVPPHHEVTKQQKLKQYERAQQKAHEDMLKKRQTKVIAYRNSKLPKPPTGLKNNDFDDINFLKGIK